MRVAEEIMGGGLFGGLEAAVRAIKENRQTRSY